MTKTYDSQAGETDCSRNYNLLLHRKAVSLGRVALPLLVVRFSVARVQPRTTKGITDLLLLFLVRLDSPPVPVGVLGWGGWPHTARLVVRQAGLGNTSDASVRLVYQYHIPKGRSEMRPKTTTW